MAQLLTDAKIERLYLPSTKDKDPSDPDCAWVDFNVGPLTAGDTIEVGGKDNESKATVKILVERIVDWSYTDVSGAKLPITFDVVRKLNFVDYQFLGNQIPDDNSIDPEQKKS